jgi:heat shock protein HslJ
MSRLFQLSGLVVAAVVVLACADATVSSDEPDPVADLAGTSWLVTTIDGQVAVPDAPPTITFGDDGTVNGSGGCNQYSGPYEIDNGSISIGELASTLMLCEGAIGTRETAFLNALRGATSWRIDETGKLGLDGAGLIVAEPAAQTPTPETSPS